MTIAGYKKFSESIFMETIILVISGNLEIVTAEINLGGIYIRSILGRVDLLNYLVLLFLYPVKF